MLGTGHRPQKLGGFGDTSQPYHRSQEFLKLVGFLKHQLTIARPDQLISGCALGFDQALFQAGLGLNIPVVAAVPFQGFDSKWQPASRNYLEELLKQATTIQIVSDPPYEARKLHLRNQWMADHSNFCLSLWDGTDGGTQACISYCQQINRRTYNLWDDWLNWQRNQNG